MRPGTFLLGSFVYACLCISSHAQLFTDDFEDGNDNGWQHYAPLQTVGQGGVGSWTVFGGTYNLQATASTLPGTYGPSRIGALQTTTYSDCRVEADFVAWDEELDQLFGIITRIAQPGLGSTDGYAIAYGTRYGRAATGRFELFRITNEAGTTLAFQDYTLQSTQDYRFVFYCRSNQMRAEIYSLNAPSVPVVVLTATDSTYASGPAGVFGYDNTPGGARPVDFTIDNFFSDVARPKLTISYNQITGDVTVKWPDWAIGYRLESTLDLTTPTWNTITSNISLQSGEFVYMNFSGGQEFFRLVKP